MTRKTALISLGAQAAILVLLLAGDGPTWVRVALVAMMVPPAIVAVLPKRRDA